jgi:tRNA (guanine37-N1)-methyltransferase
MLFRILSLQPGIFDSFFEHSLIARGVTKGIISKEIINWREKYGVGGYNQVDDKPFGGGHGMVIQADPVFKALNEFNAISSFYTIPSEVIEHSKVIPNNSRFFSAVEESKKTAKPIKKATIMLTPRGFSFKQKTAEWIVGSFDEITILCGRYEGFDARVNDLVDMELSVGEYVLNGGEVAAMSIIESVARLIPGFVTKGDTVLHDTFSTSLNSYNEQKEYIVGKNTLKKIVEVQDDLLNFTLENTKTNLFNDNEWTSKTLPFIEHPQYTRPETWNNSTAPKVLLEGNHKLIDLWRKKWY